MLKVNQLNKFYNKGKSNQIHVMNDISFELPNTGLITFFGPSGSGKTTLLNVIGGLDKAAGEISYDALTMSSYKMGKVDAYRAVNIGYIYQNYRLLTNQTVYDNLRIALEIIGITDAEEVDKRITNALQCVRMMKYRKKKAFALSGGQQQRVSIARALVKQSKIIIADEPTGNLDSQNTLEVMNILKQISKTTLVLLVTHDRNLCNYFSDEVFFLSDGKIIDRKENDGSASLRKDMTETIYLKDLTKYEEATEFGKITYYQEQDGLDMDIKMFMKNGTVYIESNLPIKLLADSNLKIKDEHFADEMVLEQNFEFDTSWYEDKKHSFQFKQFLYSIGQTISKFFSGRKKEKFLYFCLFLIGCVLAFSIVSLLNSTSVDVSEFYYNQRYSALLNEEKEVEARTVLKEAYEKDAIDTIVGLQEVTYTYRRNISFNETLNLSGISYMLPFVDSKVKVGIGRAVEEADEIVIYRKLAESIIKESPHGLSYNDILGSTISLYSLGYTNDFKIVGISDKDQGIVYISNEVYGNILFHRDHSYTVVSRDARKEVDENGDSLYRIVKGRDVDLDSYTDYPEVLVNADSFPNLSNSDLPYKSNINGKIVVVVGSYQYKYEIENRTYISNRYTTTASIANAGALTEDYYLLIEGREIQNKNEVIVPYLSNYEIGADANGYTVVGKYTGSSLAMTYGMLMNEQSAIIENYSNTAFFNVKNANVLKEIASNSGHRFSDSLRSQALIINDINKTSVIIYESLFFVLFFVALVFTYLIMRSKMINEIYDIGVYRSLGASKKYVYFKFLREAFVLTIFTVLVGYVLTASIYTAIMKFLYNVTSYNILIGSNYFIAMGILIVFASMILFGMLPIIKLLRKTPTEICMQYDI